MAMEIGNTTLNVEKNQYGVMLRITRDNRNICLSKPQWCKLEKELNNATNEGFKLKLTSEKTVERIIYDDRIFISFVKTCKNKKTQESFDIFINFSECDWETLINSHAREISYLLKSKVNKEYPKPRCNKCFDIRLPITLECGKRVKKTKLSESEYEKVSNENLTVENQLGATCSYCGTASFMCYDECHCHNYDCEHCSTNNFCKQCKAIIVHTVN